MKILSWNCRGLASPSTITQLKESLRLFKPELIFISETKRKVRFIKTICKKIGVGREMAGGVAYKKEWRPFVGVGERM